MKRKQRTEILINGSQKIAEEMAREIEQNYPVFVVKEPENGLVMMKIRETAHKSLFYLGEVMITECKVQIEETIGIGIVKGHQPKLAHNLAIIDAAFEANLPQTTRWVEVLKYEEKKIQDAQKARNQDVLKTKVNFETMDV
jgi:alpha-D-ribose 1-methylphosphonate 5-triphosphate synthase subunit PhnG